MQRENLISIPQKEKPIRLLTTISLILIVGLAIFLRFYQLGASGYGNEYYAATVKSMLTSWHNFFFAAYEPGGSVTVDKPPLGFWLEAASTLIFGFNGFALAFPNALAGVLSVLLLFFLVKKHFGDIPALIAALVLACTPITIATERNNTIDGMLVFVLLLATWAFWKAVDSGKNRYLYLGSILVGLGFNIKMLQAYMVLPALYLLYWLGSRQKWGQRLLHLGLATLVLVAVSLSWTLIVDATPASERPYIGSSTNNSVMELIVGHNGIERLTQNMGNGRQNDGAAPGNFNPGTDASGPQGLGEGPFSQEGMQAPSGNQPQGNPHSAGQPPSTDNNLPPQGNREEGTRPDFSGNGPMGGSGGQMNPGGMQNSTGRAGLVRLFTQPLASQASWLLPLALVTLVLFSLLAKRASAQHEHWLGLFFWAAWLLPMAGYFTFTTGLWHTYYLIMLGPGIAALSGISVWLMLKLKDPAPTTAKILLTLSSGLTIAFAMFVILSASASLKTLAYVLPALWLITTLLFWWRPRQWSLLAVSLTLLVAPMAWAILTTLNPNPDTNLPSAEPAATLSATGRLSGNNPSTTVNTTLLEYLLENTQENQYLLATQSSHEASPYILATGRPVLTFGGFTGQDNVIDADQLADLVNSGKVRFVLQSSETSSDSGINNWVKNNCTVVQLDADATTNSFTKNGPQNGTLYDCQKTSK